MDRPLASNEDPVGRQKNRRVEFHIKQDKPADDEAQEADQAEEADEEQSEETSDEDGLGDDPASW
jgi:hypothetical protein